MASADVESLYSFQDHPQYEWIKSHLEANTIVAHNASFDIGVLANEGIYCKDFIDTKALAMKKWPNAPRHRLQHLRYWLDLDECGDQHTAMGDVQTLMALWKAIASPSLSTVPAPVGA
jgi:DNA polymerase III epsilon subunit-like protein